MRVRAGRYVAGVANSASNIHTAAIQMMTKLVPKKTLDSQYCSLSSNVAWTWNSGAD